MQLTKLYSRLMTLMFEEEILVNWYWFISSKVTKNVDRSNEEIDKIMEFMEFIFLFVLNITIESFFTGKEWF